MKPNDPKSSLGRDRLNELDALRFLAAAAVMLYHFTYTYTSAPGHVFGSVQAVTRHGYLGVDVFFVISGFVVLWSAKGRSPSSFVRARVMRLYPEFWICVFVSALIFGLVSGGASLTPDLSDVLINLTMVPGYLGAPFVDGVYWTLAVELKFYFLLWILLVMGQVGNAEGWMYAWLAMSLLATAIDVGGVIRSLVIFPYGHLFASGALFFLIFESGWTPRRAVGVGTGLLLGMHHGILQMDGFIDSAHITGAATIVTALVLTGTYGIFALMSSRRWAWAEHRYIGIAGMLTYPLYLLHNTGRELFIGEGPADLYATVSAILVSLALSYFVMRIGTGPFRRVLQIAWDRMSAWTGDSVARVIRLE